MVRWLSLTLVVALALSMLGGCGGTLPWEIKYGNGLPPGEIAAGDENGNTTPPGSPPPPPAAPGEQVKTGMNLVPGG